MIWAGCSAICKAHIRSVQSRYESGSAGASNRVTITTAEHRRYVVWCLHAENVCRIRDWCGRCGCPSFFSISPSFLFGKKSRQTKANCRKDIPQRLGLANVLHKTDGSHTNRPFFRAMQAVRVGSALLSKRPSSPAVPFVSFLQGEKHPLNKQRRTRCSECGALRCVSCFICRCCGKRPHSRSRWRCLSTIPPAAPARRSPAAMRARFRAERSVPYHREHRPPAPRPRGRR